MHTPIRTNHHGRMPRSSLVKAQQMMWSPLLSGPMLCVRTKTNLSCSKPARRLESYVDPQPLLLQMMSQVMVSMMPYRPSLGSLLVGEVVEGGKRMPESPLPAGYSRPVRQVGEIRGFGDERAAGPAAARRSGRELFPLPCMPIPPDKVGGCRTVSRRRKRIQHHTENLNAVIRSLNWLAGCKESDVIPGGQMQEDVVARLDGLVFDQKPSGVNATLTSEGALRELLRGSSPYDGHGANECLASYKAELVSVPSDTRGCPSLMDVLPPDDRRYLEEGSELMIRPLSEMPNQEEMPIPYWDPKLKFNRKEYNKLVVKLHDIGFFNYTIEPRCRVGVFFVWKSNRTKLRLITDARRSNIQPVLCRATWCTTHHSWRLGKVWSWSWRRSFKSWRRLWQTCFSFGPFRCEGLFPQDEGSCMA